MRWRTFAVRNWKELLRDPLSLVFGIGFPIVLISMISLMQRSIQDMPAEVFGISRFAPGMAVFSLSFLSLFLGMLIANDRENSFLVRLFSSPLTGSDYILGYAVPVFPIAMLQSIVCLTAAVFFGFAFHVRVLLALVVLFFVSALFIGFGLLFGVVFSAGQVGGIGSIMINGAAWLSGTWFPVESMGGVFRTVCERLPFVHAVDAVKAAVAGTYETILPDLLWVLGYSAVLFAAAVALFRKKMRGCSRI